MPPRKSVLTTSATRELALYVAVALVTLGATIVALELWNMRWEVPLSYHGDALLIASHIKTDIEQGWYEYQPLLGAPFGQTYHDWKSADNLHHLVISAGRFLVSDWATAINLYYIAGFVLAGLTATCFLRVVGVSRAVTGALAVLFAIAPYHLIRGEGHLWLASYYPIPLALVVVYRVARGHRIWGRHATRTGVLGWLTGPGAFTIFALALVGTANSYYAFFAILLIALAGLARLIASRQWRPFAAAVAAGVLGVVVMVVNMLPDIIFSRINGANAIAVVRLPQEAEIYALKFMSLVLPMPDHRVGMLKSLRTLYETVYPFGGEQPVLGLVAATGFVGAFVFILSSLLGRIARPARPRVGPAALPVLAALILFSFMLATVGGLSSFISFFTSDLRGWNRISILIAMLSLAFIGVVIDRLVTRARASQWGSRLPARVLAAAVAVAVLVVGFLDQTSPGRVPQYAAVQEQFEADADLVEQIERSAGADGMVLQLPFMQFPETPPVNGVLDTAQIALNLHSDTLSWSGGGIKGRPASEWVGIAERSMPGSDLAIAAAAAGFDGVLVDRRPFDDGGRGMVSDLQGLLGDPAFSAQDDRYVYFDLGPLSADLEAVEPDAVGEVGDWLVNPVYARFAPDYDRGFTVLETLEPYVPGILLDNPRSEPVQIELSFTVTYVLGDATLRFTDPSGNATDVEVDDDPTTTTLVVTAPPGRSEVLVTVVEGPPAVKGRTTDGPIQLGPITVTDTELHRAIDDVRSALDAR